MALLKALDGEKYRSSVGWDDADEKRMFGREFI